MRARMTPGCSSAYQETFVRLGKQLVVLDRRPDRGEVELLEVVEVGVVDHALRVADLDVLEAPCAPAGLELAGALAIAGRVVRRRRARAAHVQRARVRPGDVRADLAGAGLDREAVAVGPAVAAQEHGGLARPVARQAGLRAVGVEDPQPCHEARLVGLGEQQDAVRSDAGVDVADALDALRRQLDGSAALSKMR